MQMLLQRQHFLLSYFKTLSDGPAGQSLTHDLPHSSPMPNQLNYWCSATVTFLVTKGLRQLCCKIEMNLLNQPIIIQSKHRQSASLRGNSGSLAESNYWLRKRGLGFLSQHNQQMFIG